LPMFIYFILYWLYSQLFLNALIFNMVWSSTATERPYMPHLCTLTDSTLCVFLFCFVLPVQDSHPHSRAGCVVTLLNFICVSFLVLLSPPCRMFTKSVK
jgi:hypothetical protein